MRFQRKALFASAIVLSVLAIAIVPVFAAKPSVGKTVGMTVTPNTVTAGASEVYEVTVTNTTPGNSNPNSFLIAAPSGWDVTNAAYVSGTNGNAGRSVVFNSATDTVAVTGLDPLKSTGGPNVKISVTATATAVSGCGSSTGLWAITAYTGSGLSGDTFTRNTADALVTTTATAGCGIGIVAPDSTITGNTFSVTAQALSGGSVATTYVGSFDLALSGTCSATVKQKPAVNGEATFSVTADSVGSCSASVTSPDLSGSASATISIYNAGITCGGQSDEISGGGTTSQLFRTDVGPASGCIDVPYTLRSEDDLVVLLKDQAIITQQGAEFKLVITWGIPASDYPNFGVTTFDLDSNFTTTGDAFTPDNCTVVSGVAQVPDNPSGGVFWPAGSAEQPWCHAGTVIEPSGTGYQITETFLGAGDPSIVRNR